VLNTRIPTAAVYQLHELGYSLDAIHVMYPEAPREALTQAIEFERSLLRHAA